MKRKKILWLCSWYPSPAFPYNGDFIRRHAESVAAFHEVHILHAWPRHLSSDTQVTAYTPPAGLTEILVPFSGFSFRGLRVLNHLAWRRAMRQALQDYELKFGRPDLVHVHVAMNAGVWGRWIKKHWGIPYLLSEHSSAFLPGVPERWTAAPLWLRQRLKSVVKAADSCSLVSATLREGFLTGFPDASVRIIPNVVNTALFYPVSGSRERQRFIHISGMQELKNPRLILEAFSVYAADHPDAELYMVGGVDSALQSFAGSWGLQSRIKFLPEIPQHELATLLRTCTALVMYSSYETFGCVVIEALASGVPVIAADIPVFRELVEEGVNGTLVPPDQVVALARALERISREGVRDSAASMAAKTRERFGYETVGRRFSDWYAELNP